MGSFETFFFFFFFRAFLVLGRFLSDLGLKTESKRILSMTSKKDQSCDPGVGVERQVPRVRQSVSLAICYPLYLDKKLAEVFLI